MIKEGTTVIDIGMRRERERERERERDEQEIVKL